MTRKRTVPKEGPTKPGRKKVDEEREARTSGPAPKKKHPSEVPTLPPPPPSSSSKGGRKSIEPRMSGFRPRKPSTVAATVDEVTADLSRDPRRDKDDDDE
jgi:hypothetical protein